MSRPRWIAGVGVVGACAGLGFLAWWVARPAVLEVEPSATTLRAPTHKAIAGDLGPVLEVFAYDGTPLELAQAINTLDTITRLSRAIPDNERDSLLSAMEHGTPAGMSEGPWSHLFNSACNALAAGRTDPDEKLMALLERIAVDDPRLVMRLYALQHLGLRYDAAPPACQERMRSLVQRILAAPKSQTAGTALVLWQRWEKTAGPGELSTLDLSRAIVADTARPLDVRVTAFHAMGDDPSVLDLARAIAPDPAQPLILRKAALNLIGRHGQAQDLVVLRQCSQESSRLEQAGTPAAIALEKRLSGSPQPVLIPIQ